MKANKISNLLNGFSRRTLYVKLILLMFCFVITVLLMQASTVFLFDYIPYSQSAIAKINEQEQYWRRHLEASSNGRAGSLTLTTPLPYLDTSDPAMAWMFHQGNQEVVAALKQLERAQQHVQQLTLSNRMHIREVISAYDALEKVLYHDAEVKKSVVTLLHAVGLVFLFSCMLMLAIGARRVLVERLDNLLAFIQHKTGERAGRQTMDEFEMLEHRVAELSAQMENYESKVTWAHRTSQQMRVLIRAQEFILQLIETVSNETLSERTLLKMLYALERSMDFSNTALHYTDDAAVVAAERIIYSQYEPPVLSDDVFGDLQKVGMTTINHRRFDTEVSCVCVMFDGVNMGVGVLMVEMPHDRYLDESEIKLLEIIARLLSMAVNYQSHNEEGRRLAVLEERAAIARELHDSLAQSLSFMKIQMARLQNFNVEEKAQAIVQELRQGLDNAYGELRELLTTFRVHMDLRGLGYAIQATIDEFSQRSQLDIVLDNRLVNCRLTVNEEFHILHVVREALSNIVRHSGAKHVAILMLLKKSGEVQLTIDDDGVGYSPASSTYDHHGQAIMKERAKTLGGDVEVMARRYGGTRVRLTFMPKTNE